MTELDTIPVKVTEIARQGRLNELFREMATWVEKNPDRLLMDIQYDCDEQGDYHLYIYHRES
jgi:hypothetical protein